MRSPIRNVILALTLFVSVIQVSVGNACSVPVFRYALEHWQPDPYVAFVFHRGELSSEQKSILELMKPESVDGAPICNLFVKTVNVETDLEADENLKTLWEANQSETLPHLVLQSPPKWGPPQTVWSGNLSADNAKVLLESPVRNQIKKGLISGDSVVWVLLECGDKEKDDRAFALLTAELGVLQIKLKLPEIEEADLKDLTVAPDSLKISFSAVRLSKTDLAERPFVDMLLGVEPDLREEEFVNQPMVFPVFGRGRALYALVGDGIASDLIEEAGQFLTGACQCTVKRENPGVDLLMNVDWDRFIEPTEALDSALPPLAGFSGFGDPSTTGEDIIVSTDNESEAATDVEATLEPNSDPKPGSSENAESSNVAVSEATQEDSGARSDSPAEQLFSRNLKMVLLLVVGAVVLATIFLKPRAT